MATTNQLAKQRAAFIERQRALLENNVSAIQGKLFDAVFNKLLEKLDLADGKILNNNSNIDLASTLDKIMKDFMTNDFNKVIKLFSNDLIGLQGLNSAYFKTIEEDQTKLKQIANDVNTIMRKRIGLDASGNKIKGGYLDKLSTDPKFKQELKKATYKAVTTGASMDDFKAKMKTLITGNDSVNGGLQKHFNRFVYDTYQQFDRTTAVLYSNKLDLKAFIYSGTKITTSRCFCINNKGKVFTLEEAEKWRSKLNDSCGPIWNEKKDGRYVPIDMMGGYGCVDVPNFISNRMAIRLRPDLEAKLSST